MNKIKDFAKKALYFASRVVAAGVLPVIGTYYWTSANHHNYWNRTIFAVQTIDFKILANTLPTKLSTLILQNDREEIQRVLQSNLGRFGMVVTDCKSADKDCPNQTVLYRTQSRSSWSRNFSIEDLKDAPFDILRNPPPLKTEIDFPELRSEEYKPTGQTNTGEIIGRVYYVRGIPPSYWDSWLTWLRDPTVGVGSIYTTSVTTFFASWLLLILLLEIYINKIEAKKQQNEQLKRDLEKAQEKITATLKDKSKVLADLRKAEEEQQTLLAHLQEEVRDREKVQVLLEDARVANSQMQIELQQKLAESSQVLTTYEQELKANTEYIDGLQKSIAFHQENFVPQIEIDAYQEQLNEANSNQTRLLKLIESQSQDIRLNQQSLQFLSEEKIELEAQLAAAALEIGNINNRVTNLETEKQNLEDSIIKIQSDKDEAVSKAQELQQKLDSLLVNQNKPEANLQQLLEEATNYGENLVEQYKQDLRDKDIVLNNEKLFYEMQTEYLNQQIDDLKTKIEKLGCELISARSDRDYFISQLAEIADIPLSEIAEVPLVDISSLHIGFVGGELKSLNRAINRLQKDHGLINYVTLEVGYSYNQNMFRSKLKNCNLIAFICVAAIHPYWYMVKNLQDREAITNNLLHINFTGEIAVVREIVQYYNNLEKRGST